MVACTRPGDAMGCVWEDPAALPGVVRPVIIPEADRCGGARVPLVELIYPLQLTVDPPWELCNLACMHTAMAHQRWSAQRDAKASTFARRLLVGPHWGLHTALGASSPVGRLISQSSTGPGPAPGI